jgi:hypothetical protein
MKAAAGAELNLKTAVGTTDFSDATDTGNKKEAAA